MKKIFYLLTLLSVSLFMISCSESTTDDGGTKPPTEITLDNLTSLVGDYTVDNYTITVKTEEEVGTEIRSTTVAGDNYTLVQGFLSDAAIINNGDELTIAILISNDSIVSKVAEVNLTADQLKSYPSFYNIFVNKTAIPILSDDGNTLGDVDALQYEIVKINDKTIKVTYKTIINETTTAGTITRVEIGDIILTKISNTATTVPTEKISLYKTELIDNANDLFAPVGRYAISKYEYVKTGTGAKTTTITADSTLANEKNLIGGLSVGLGDLTLPNIIIVMDISMQTDNALGFEIDANKNGTTTDKYIFRNLLINVGPIVDDIGIKIPAILIELGADIAADGKSMKFKLTNDQEYIKHNFPLNAGDSITLTLEMMNDGGLSIGAFTPFDDKKFF